MTEMNENINTAEESANTEELGSREKAIGIGVLVAAGYGVYQGGKHLVKAVGPRLKAVGSKAKDKLPKKKEKKPEVIDAEVTEESEKTDN